MKQWYRFEIIYQKVNPFSFETKKKLYSNYQSAFCENIKDAEQHAINLFKIERIGDKMISIRCIN
jgi:hypothetical protein